MLSEPQFQMSFHTHDQRPKQGEIHTFINEFPLGQVSLEISHFVTVKMNF